MKILHYPAIGVYLYASTDMILHSALQGCENRLDSGVAVPLSEGEMLSIDERGNTERAAFDADDLLSVGGYYGAPDFRPASFGNSSYVRELKSIASSFGCTPEDIDEMLSCGYSPEEIEEYFYEREEGLCTY